MASSRLQQRVAGSAGRAKHWTLAHKWWSALILVVVLFGGYKAYAASTAPSTAPKYATATVASSSVASTLSETGQVSSSQELAIAPKASGELLAIYVTPGEHVYAGQALAQLDGSDAARSLANAKLSLQSQEIQYQQSTASSTLALNLLEAENAVTNDQIALQKAHDSGYASISGIYSDLSGVISDLDSALHDSDVATRAAQQNENAYADLVSEHDQQAQIFATSAESSYRAAFIAYNAAVATYKAAGISASDQDLMTLAGSTYTAAQAVAQAVKDTHDFYDRISTDYTLYNYKSDSTLAGLLSKVSADQTVVGNDMANALSTKSGIVSAEQAVAESQNTLSEAQTGSNALTIQQATLALEQAQQAVQNAQEAVNNYTVVAPFSGTVVSVAGQRYAQAGSGTTIATVVTDDQTVDISVNEVDAAKLKVGQKATLSFDALPGIFIAGTVSQINALGTVSSGVVSYSAVITFDTPNASVLPGMSASASIITGSANGLVVPASAVHTQGKNKYVEIFDPALPAGTHQTSQVPEQVPVTTGLASASAVIITSGLTLGEQVVSSSGSGSVSKSAAASATSVFGGGSGARAGGGNAVFRAGG